MKSDLKPLGMQLVMRGSLLADPAVDAEARRIIAKELGHDRIDVVAEYIGAWP